MRAVHGTMWWLKRANTVFVLLQLHIPLPLTSTPSVEEIERSLE